MVLDEFILALNVCEGQLADFGAFALSGKILLPLHALEFQEKVQDVHWVHEVNKGVPHVALGLQTLRLELLTLRSMGR